MILAAQSDVVDVIVWGLVLIAAICVFALLAWWARRRFVASDTQPNGGEWTLQHLREMRKDGQITEAEFESLKAKAIEAAASSAKGRKDRATSA
ncbi:MAG: SHOCT domain-containing protein [Planctomycetota bacterium]